MQGLRRDLEMHTRILGEGDDTKIDGEMEKELVKDTEKEKLVRKEENRAVSCPGY